MKRRRRTLLISILLLTGLGAAAGQPVSPVEERRPSGTAPTEPAIAPEGWVPDTSHVDAGHGQPTSSAFGLRPPSDYVAIRERPLFSPDRSPPRFAPPEPEPPEVLAPINIDPEPDLEPPPVAETAPDWELVGVVRSQSLNSAIFRKPGESAGFSLRRGESRDGWMLAEIGRFEVYVENETGRARLAFPKAN